MDKITLQINNHMIENFESYKVTSGMFTAADSFIFQLSNPEPAAREGDRCYMYVNGELELNGLVDRLAENYDKNSGTRLTVSGRDLMGLLVDSYCEEYVDYQLPLKQFTEKLLAKVPFISHEIKVIGPGSKLLKIPLHKKDEEFEFTQVKPGDTILDVIRRYALSRGYIFFATPSGQLVFSTPETSRPPDFTLINKKSGPLENNVITAERTRDISRMYSKIMITDQKQGTDNDEPEDINISAELISTDYPFYADGKPTKFYKPFVAGIQDDGKEPKKYAAVLMDNQRFEGYQMVYKTYDHSQNGRNFQFNTVCHVLDDIFGLEQGFLIYERTFEMDKNEGVTTTLKLAKMGVQPA